MKVRAIAVLLAVCLHMTVARAAKPSAPLADRLPAGTLAYAGWAGRSLTFDGSMFGQLLNDPDIAKIVRAVGQAAQMDIRNADKQNAFGRAWSMADIAWQHPVALALIDLQKGDHGPDPTAVLLIDLDTDREAFAKQLDGLLELIKEDFPLTEATLGGVTYRVYRPDKGPEISIGYLGNTLFVGIGGGAPKALVERPLAGQLSADKKFTECLQAVAEGNVQMAYYLDIEALAGKVEQFVPSPAAGGGPNAPKPPAQKVREMTAAMGLDKVSAVAGATWVVDRGLYSRTRVFTPAPHRGLLMALAGPEITDADLAGVPEDADFVLAARLSAQTVWDELRRAVKDASPDVDREFDKNLGELEETLGISLSRDLLGQLGNRWVLSSAPSRGGFLAGTMLTVDVKNPVELAGTLKKIEDRLLPPPPAPVGDNKPSPPPSPGQPRVETLKFARADIRYLALPSRREPMPIAPAWTVHKKHLMLAGYPQVIQSAVAVNGAAKPLTQTADFRSARGRISGKPSMLFYCNGPKMARQVYHWAMVGWTMAANALAGEGVMDARASWLPPLATIEQYLRPSIATVCPDADGITFESYGSLPNATPLAGLLLNPLTLWISVPAAQEAREKALATRDSNELKIIAMAVAMYQLDHGKLPASLLDPKMRTYLGNDRLHAALAKGQYIYLGSQLKAANPKNPANTVMVYRDARDDPFVLTAFLDGHIERVERQKFLQLLAAQGIKP